MRTVLFDLVQFVGGSILALVLLPMVLTAFGWIRWEKRP